MARTACLIGLLAYGIEALTASPDGALSRFLARPPERPDSYTAERRLEAASPRLRKHGWLTAITRFVNGQFEFRVTGSGGSELIVTRVLRAALEAEREALGRDPRASALSTRNYIFSLDTSGRTRITPRRRDPLLVDGRLLLTDEGDLVGIQGRLSKAPSFWTTDVNVERAYARIIGVRVPVRMSSTAKVRFAGTSTFAMTYTYTEINGIAVEGSQ